jgi:hypothetical protein
MSLDRLDRVAHALLVDLGGGYEFRSPAFSILNGEEVTCPLRNPDCAVAVGAQP